jgi:hypothetical protein
MQMAVYQDIECSTHIENHQHKNKNIELQIIVMDAWSYYPLPNPLLCSLFKLYKNSIFWTFYVLIFYFFCAFYVLNYSVLNHVHFIIKTALMISKIFGQNQATVNRRESCKPEKVPKFVRNRSISQEFVIRIQENWEELVRFRTNSGVFFGFTWFAPIHGCLILSKYYHYSAGIPWELFFLEIPAFFRIFSLFLDNLRILQNFRNFIFPPDFRLNSAGIFYYKAFAYDFFQFLKF